MYPSSAWILEDAPRSRINSFRIACKMADQNDFLSLFQGRGATEGFQNLKHYLRKKKQLIELHNGEQNIHYSLAMCDRR